MSGSCLRRLPLAATSLLVAASAAAGTPAALTAADYAHAERLMPYDTTPLVLHSVSDVTWLGDGRDQVAGIRELARRDPWIVRHLLGSQPPREYALHPPAGVPLGHDW